ncbi:hypothetical protein D3C84_442320 [compost metagenome]
MATPGNLLCHRLCLLVILLVWGWPPGPSALPPAHWCRHDLYRVLRTSLPWP